MPEGWIITESQTLRRMEEEGSLEMESGEELRKTYVLQGTLSQIAEAGDFRFRFTPSSSNLPANLSFYQKAVLTDESGSLPVYLTPTALSREELEASRLHLVQMVQNKNHEICYVITQSCCPES